MGIEYNYSSYAFTEFVSNIPEDEKRLWYAEKFFNHYVSENFGYLNLDRDIIQVDKFRLELTDLVFNDAFIFVKIGTPQKLSYVIDQSIASLQYLAENNGRIPVNGEPLEPQKLVLWLILDRVTPIAGLNDLNSLIFLMKLEDWRKKVTSSGLTPIVWISYKTD